ncbi:hypothetical protein ACFFGQ_17205 [Rufibacter quisquiliarum]|uniref:Signal transduction histidine kinase n=1 Tax=Rufibacter quisquiliarum TaxID=1549639 RepID=A0A839GRK2_9BACT|nr:signal transduction histidine kinase [Rufibacter quisquiliarum]
MLVSITESYFVGFGVFYLLGYLVSYSRKDSDTIFSPNIEASMLLAVKWAGFLYLPILILEAFWNNEFSLVDDSYFAVINRMFGPYWFYFWLKPILFLVATSFLWSKKVRASRFTLLLIAFLLLFTHFLFDRISSLPLLNRDFLPSSWTIISKESFFERLLAFSCHLVIFAVSILIVSRLRREALFQKLKRHKG